MLHINGLGFFYFLGWHSICNFLCLGGFLITIRKNKNMWRMQQFAFAIDGPGSHFERLLFTCI